MPRGVPLTPEQIAEATRGVLKVTHRAEHEGVLSRRGCHASEAVRDLRRQQEHASSDLADHDCPHRSRGIPVVRSICARRQICGTLRREAQRHTVQRVTQRSRASSPRRPRRESHAASAAGASMMVVVMRRQYSVHVTGATFSVPYDALTALQGGL